MSSICPFDSSEVNVAVYNNYMEKKLCYICIRASTGFVDNNATNAANRTVIDKLKFICKEYENDMFPPSDIPVNICYKCDCNISAMYSAKQKLVSTLKFWHRFFNLTHYDPRTNDTYKPCSKMELDEPKYFNNALKIKAAPPVTAIKQIENVFIEEPAVPSTSNHIVNDLKGFLNFKDEPETSADATVLIKEEKINENASTSKETNKPNAMTETASTSFAKIIPMNVIANCSKDTLTPLNILNTGFLPQTSEIKFVNVSTIPGRKTIFNQVDPSIFIKDAVNNIFLCLKCNRQFAELRYLSRHLKLHCNEQDGLFPCTDCNRKFLTQSYLEKHMYCHSANAAFKCEQCSLGFTTELLLERHMECHSKVKKYFCDVCKRGYRMRYELTMHMEVHAGKTYPCKICQKTFATQRLLDKHLKRHKNPTPAKSYTCEVCAEELRGQTSLKNHLRKHKGIKFECPHCDKFYYNQTQLKLHLCKHNNDRKFACTVCDKKFYTAQILENHSYSHSDVRNFVCEFCGKTYGMKSALYIHSREHAPFKCKLCKKGFWKSRNLTAHINRVHNGDTEPEETTENCSDDSETDDDNNNKNKLVIVENNGGDAGAADDVVAETNMNID